MSHWSKLLTLSIPVFGLSLPLWYGLTLILLSIGVTVGAVWVLFPFILTLAVFVSSVFVFTGLAQQRKIQKKQVQGYVLLFTVMGGVLAYRSFVLDTLRGFSLPISGQSFASYPRIDMQYTLITLLIVFIAYAVVSVSKKHAKNAPMMAIGLVFISLFAFLGLGVGRVEACYDGRQVCSDEQRATTFDVEFPGYVSKAVFGIELSVDQPTVTKASVVREEDIRVSVTMQDSLYSTSCQVNIGDLGFTEWSKPYQLVCRVFGNPDGSQRTYDYTLTAVTKDGDKAVRTGEVMVSG